MELVSPQIPTLIHPNGIASRKDSGLLNGNDLSGYYSSILFFYRNKFDFRRVFCRGKPVMTVLLRYMYDIKNEAARRSYGCMRFAAPAVCWIFPVIYDVWKDSGALCAVYLLQRLPFYTPLIISIVCGMSASVEEQAVIFR